MQLLYKLTYPFLLLHLAHTASPRSSLQAQTSPVLCGVRALHKTVITFEHIHMRKRLRKLPFNLTLLQAQYSSYIQGYKAEMPMLMDTFEIWLV